MAYAAWSDLVMTARRTGEPLPTISGTLTTARPDRHTRDAAIDIATGRFGDPRPAPAPRNGRPERQHHAGTSPAPAQETASRRTGALLAPDARTPAGRITTTTPNEDRWQPAAAQRDPCDQPATRDSSTPAQRQAPQPNGTSTRAAIAVPAMCWQSLGTVPAINEAASVARTALPAFVGGLGRDRLRHGQDPQCVALARRPPPWKNPSQHDYSK
jgi:hypothetical protein